MAAGEKMWTEKRSLIWRKGDELTAWPGLDIIQNNKEKPEILGAESYVHDRTAQVVIPLFFRTSRRVRYCTPAL